MHRADAAHIVGDGRLRRDVGDGVLERVWRGMYRFSDDAPSHADEHYRERVIAAAVAGGDERSISHSSAAAVHRLRLLDPDRRVVHFVTKTGGRETATLFVHRDRRLLPSDIEIVDGVQVTTLARTAADVARAGTYAQAVTVLDAALARGVSKAALEVHVRRGHRQHGVTMLRSASAVADGRSESVAESFSRAVMLTFPDVPAPEIQVEICNDEGQFVARVDFLIAGKVVGEMDGRAKYRSETYGRDLEQVLYEEKLREDALRDLGYGIVRWCWQDLVHPERLHTKVKRALERARRVP
ncbi:type IV toxin-antitoxin system AbiEi family antitoxin domain-containing protein [Gordonia insulae]|uniref:type IV toxin-antitoxin system AbiEi family antitoxin domain-containing protein n=1 Tax=Gordonia insulae TaxID=2420509 RepID=UPI000F5BDBFF|nr:hypothetical protein [Gordonia insulae]